MRFLLTTGLCREVIRVNPTAEPERLSQQVEEGFVHISREDVAMLLQLLHTPSTRNPLTRHPKAVSDARKK